MSMPFRMSVGVAPKGKDTPTWHIVPAGMRGVARGAPLLAILGVGCGLAACSVVGATVAVGSAAVSTVTTVGSAAISVGSTVVETTYDVTKAGVKAAAGSGD